VVARTAGANLGLFAVGKRLIFVEGNDASIDRLTYHKLAQTAFPDSYIMPIGSVENVIALRSVIDELSNAIFGIELFMIRDRDGLSDEIVSSLEKNPRFRCLRTPHVENYFLDEQVLLSVAEALYLPAEVRDLERIRLSLSEIAAKSLMPAVLWNTREYIRIIGAISQPTVRQVDQFSIDELIDSISSQVEFSLSEIASTLDRNALDNAIRSEYARLESALNSEAYKFLLPGKLIFKRFCGEFFRTEASRVREAYLDIAIKSKPDVVGDITNILTSFASIASSPNAS
jgi:hypothetical protein